MRGDPGRTERSAEPYLPYLGHVRPDVVLLEDSSLLAMGALHGLPHELAAEDERNADARLFNSLWRNIADDTVTVGVHFVRHRRVDGLPPSVFHNAFSAELDQAYRNRVLAGRLYENTWFLSLIKAPRNPAGGSAGGRAVARSIARLQKRDPAVAPELIAELEDLWGAVARSLETCGLRRLGLRERGPVVFSEIAEALRLILTAEFLPVPLVSGLLGNAIYTDRAIFGRRAYEICAPGASRFGAIFGFREYPATTWPGMLDSVLSLPSLLVLSQSFSFLARPDALAKLSLKANQMAAGGDKALSQIEDLALAQDRLASGEFVMGMHHLSLAVYADTIAELDGRAGTARGELANCGAVVAQESLGMEAAYFAQLPGNLGWRTRPGAISSRNFAHLAGFDAFPRGQKEGRWGPAMLQLKTTAATPYDYVPHVDDVGMTAIFGRIGSGKTTFLLFLLAMFDQYMTDRCGAVVFFDKDRGGELLVRAVGGRYLVVRSGEPSGLAPLCGLDNTAASRAFLVKWLKALIGLDGHGPLPPEDDRRLARAIAGVMKMPRELRSIEGLRQFLGWRDSKGAGARLERWCRGGALGWAFDGGDDQVDLDAGMVGFDLTQILGDATIVEPAAHYLLHRIRTVVDGRRFVLSCDEFRAYLINPQFAEMWEDFMLTVRKSNAIVLLVTQQPEHVLVGSAFGATLVGQCFTKIFFPTPTADERVYREELHLTAGEFRAVREDMLPGSRQFLIKRETGSVIVDFDLSAMPEYVAVLSSRANTVRFAERLRHEAGSEDPAAWLPAFKARFREAVD
jgi:type IV secretion system protein VirB4